jgi:putative FmdB family regulatory protein
VPLYEYECRACGHRFERIQTYSAPLVRKCPKCRKSKVKKLLSAPAVQFKGTGWYITDYQRKGSSATLPDTSEKAKEEKERKEEKEGKEAKASKEGTAEPGGKKDRKGKKS